MDKRSSKRIWLIVIVAAVVIALGLGRLIGPENDDAFLIAGLAVIVVILVIALVAMLRQRRRGG